MRFASTALAIVILLGGALPARAQHAHGQAGGAEAPGHSHEKASIHGGQVTMTEEFHMEAVFLPDSLRVYLYDGQQNPLPSAQGVTGKVTVESRGGETAALELAHRPSPGEGEMDYLEGAYEFAALKRGQARVTIALEKLPGTSEKSIRTKMKFPGISKVRGHGAGGHSEGEAPHAGSHSEGEAPHAGSHSEDEAPSDGAHDHGAHDH